MDRKKKEELDKIIKEESLNPEETYKFLERVFLDGEVKVLGTEIIKILPPISKFSPNNTRAKKKDIVINKITNFFNRFFSISSSEF